MHATKEPRAITAGAIVAQQLVQRSEPHERRGLGVEFTPRQRVWLSRGLVALCQWRLEHILHHCDPLDLPLEQFLKEQVAAEEESADSLKRLDWMLPRSADVVFCSKECDQLLSDFLPSAFCRFGEGLLNREAALHFVELLDSDRHAFFSLVLEGLSDELPRIRLKAESDRSADRLRIVRTVVLPPAQCAEKAPMLTTDKDRCDGAIERRARVISVSGQINRLREVQQVSHFTAEDRAGTGPSTALWSPVAIDLMSQLTGAALVAMGSDEPLAQRFLQEFGDLRERGLRSPEDILGVARIALAWLMCGHTRRSAYRSGTRSILNASA